VSATVAAGRTVSTEVAAEDLVALARGAAVLGTGGGGDPYIGELFVTAQIKNPPPREGFA